MMGLRPQQGFKIIQEPRMKLKKYENLPEMSMSMSRSQPHHILYFFFKNMLLHGYIALYLFFVAFFDFFASL